MRATSIALALTLLAATGAAASTNCPASFVHPHLTYLAGWTEGYQCMFNPAFLLREKGFSLLLDEYIARLIERGELPEKRIHLDGYGQLGSLPPVCVRRDREEFFIDHRGALDLRNLLRTIAAFGSPAWVSFCPGGPQGQYDPGKDALLLRSYEEILDRTAPELDLAAFRSREVTVYEVGTLRVIYRDGALIYEQAGQRLDLAPAGILPVELQGRIIAPTAKGYVAIEGGRVIASHSDSGWEELAATCDDTPQAIAYRSWVNVHCGTKIFLTYSLEMNRFFTVNVDDEKWKDQQLERKIGVEIGEGG